MPRTVTATLISPERMTRARELLEASDIPLDDVAEQCGYRTPEAFRAAFRRIVGSAPGAYRRRFAHARAA